MSNQPAENLAQKIIDSTFKYDNAIRTPHALYGKAVTAAELSVQQRILMPSAFPMAIDPKTLQEERERFLRARVDHRIRELSELGPNLENEEKIQALIELKSLKLLDKQQQMRGEILSSLSKASTLATALDRGVYRRNKKQSLREGVILAL
jgi:ATP-dependent helicase STH1/SNF2